jgi:oligoribonuclease NrnB/cAMP/cGMP phosphodiesterase (DHH superfamily)
MKAEVKKVIMKKRRKRLLTKQTHRCKKPTGLAWTQPMGFKIADLLARKTTINTSLAYSIANNNSKALLSAALGYKKPCREFAVSLAMGGGPSLAGSAPQTRHFVSLQLDNNLRSPVSHTSKPPYNLAVICIPKVIAFQKQQAVRS